MADRPDEFKLSIVDSLKSFSAREERKGITAADLATTPEEALEGLKATKGAPAVLKPPKVLALIEGQNDLVLRLLSAPGTNVPGDAIVETLSGLGGGLESRSRAAARGEG